MEKDSKENDAAEFKGEIEGLRAILSNSIIKIPTTAAEWVGSLNKLEELYKKREPPKE